MLNPRNKGQYIRTHSLPHPIEPSKDARVDVESYVSSINIPKHLCFRSPQNNTLPIPFPKSLHSLMLPKRKERLLHARAQRLLPGSRIYQIANVTTVTADPIPNLLPRDDLTRRSRKLPCITFNTSPPAANSLGRRRRITRRSRKLPSGTFKITSPAPNTLGRRRRSSHSRRRRPLAGVLLLCYRNDGTFDEEPPAFTLAAPVFAADAAALAGLIDVA